MLLVVHFLNFQLVPASTFGLGTWQVQRKKWKEDLISSLRERKYSDPVPLPKSKEELESIEYYPVYVKGTFLHDKEIYMGPRSLLIDGKTSESSLLSVKNMPQGFLVITPFKLSDREYVDLLVSMGRV